MSKQIKFSKEEISAIASVSAAAFFDKIIKKYQGKDAALFIQCFLSSFVSVVNDNCEDQVIKMEVK